MKGLTESILGYIVIVLAVITLLFFLYSQSELKGTEVSKQVHGRIFDEEARLAIIALFNNKVDFVEKPYIETIIDAPLQNETYKKIELASNTYYFYNASGYNKVFYGVGIGTFNNTEVIPPLFNYYIPGRWKLVILIPNGTSYMNVSYGNISGEPKYVYKQMIPIPEERIGKLILYIG